MADHGTIIRVSRMSKRYENERGAGVQALEGIDLEVRAGEFLCILGPTGCGKTTLLRLLAGLESRDGGSIELNWFKDGRLPYLGFMFQQHALFPWMTIEKNVAFGLKSIGLSKTKIRERCRECLELVGLTESAHSYPSELSGGMQRRAALARTLAPNPDVLLMDEPFSALDVGTSRALYDEFLAIYKRSRMTVILVTHNIEEAVYLASRIVVMASSPGRIVADTPNDLLRPRDRFGNDFVATMLKIREFFEKENFKN